MAKVVDLPKIGRWKVKNKVGVLHIDGEVGRYDLQERTEAVRKALGKDSKKHPMYILPGNFRTRELPSRINISDPEWQEVIYRALKKHDEIGLLILDNLASLTQGIDENSQRDWSHINQWLLALRDLGKAVIFVHHEGKKGGQRGTISREDHLDCAIRISKTSGHKIEHGAHFDVEIKKIRNVGPGESLKPFTLRIDSKKKSGITWTATKQKSKAKTKRKPNPNYVKAVGMLLGSEMEQSEIAEKIKVSKPMISKYRKRAVKEGLMDEKVRTPTKKGLDFLSKHKLPIPKPFSKSKVVKLHKEKAKEK